MGASLDASLDPHFHLIAMDVKTGACEKKN